MFSIARAHSAFSVTACGSLVYLVFYILYKFIGRRHCLLSLNLQYLTIFLAHSRSSVKNFLENIPCKAHVNICLVGVSLLWNGYSRLSNLDAIIHSNGIYSLFKKYTSNSCYDLDFLNAG